MNNVLGYYGTPSQRLVDWNTMLRLRQSIPWMKRQPNSKVFDIAIDKEQKWLNELMQNYKSAA